MESYDDDLTFYYAMKVSLTSLISYEVVLITPLQDFFLQDISFTKHVVL